MMLVIHTQDYENYAWQEDGTIGTGPNAYWKAKGGSEFKITGVPAGVDPDEVVEMVRSQIEQDNDYFQTSIIGYGLETDEYMSWFVKSQLEYDGVITCKEPVIEYSELQSQYA